MVQTRVSDRKLMIKEFYNVIKIVLKHEKVSAKIVANLIKTFRKFCLFEKVDTSTLNS